MLDIGRFCIRFGHYCLPSSNPRRKKRLHLQAEI
jgi:hypothetical protein